MEKVIEQINKSENLESWEKEHLTKILQKYKDEPNRTRYLVNPYATSLSNLFPFDKTIEGFHFWNEVNHQLNRGKPTGQTTLDLFK